MTLRKNFFVPDSSSSDEEAAMAVLFLHELTMAGKRNVCGTSENAFGILAARFQMFKHAINTSLKNVRDIVLATVALLDSLRDAARETYSPTELLDREDERKYIMQQGQWRNHPHAGLKDCKV
ncbi:hypothetical protein E2C01_102336 [Portunus trituberculatus]|uniref:Uncharacterized protein n=1 Tax=Portunus trituberculatus TaxID=210409 RepID=A0A5B7K7X6_PORTR|nr:hypothetical protein [Portunus trituberculatus]